MNYGTHYQHRQYMYNYTLNFSRRYGRLNLELKEAPLPPSASGAEVPTHLRGYAAPRPSPPGSARGVPRHHLQLYSTVKTAKGDRRRTPWRIPWSAASPRQSSMALVHTIGPLICFSISSSSLLVLNKLSMKHIASASLLSLIQFAFCTAFVLLRHCTGAEPVELTRGRIQAYLYFVGVFSAAIYTNMRSLASFSVETIIVVRSCCPLLVSFMESAQSSRPWPSFRMIGILVALAACGLGYAQAEASGAPGADTTGSARWAWLAAYYVLICTSDSYGKRISSAHPFRSHWGPVLYTNGLSIPPMLLASAMAGDVQRLGDIDWRAAAAPLLISCFGSLTISYFGWRCRSVCTATRFTILGVTNKLLSVLLSALLLHDRRLSPAGGLCLVGCLVFAALYRPDEHQGAKHSKLKRDHATYTAKKSGS